MIETLPDREILNKQISYLIANGAQHSYPNSIFEEPRMIVREITADRNITGKHPFKQKVGHDLAIIIAKSRDRESIGEIKPIITRLFQYL